MKAVIQRVKRAEVSVNEKITGSVGVGYMILLGVVSGDTKEDAELLARKTAALRIFTDENDKMNKSIIDVGGEILVVSQFTLCADCRKGNRPSFTQSAQSEQANTLYEYYCEQLRKNGIKNVQTGVFGEHMQVSILNNGPVTILYDTAIWKHDGEKK